VTTAGWITMLLALALVWGGAILCFRKVLQTPQEEKAPPGFGP
jgi:hypothetical protein